MGYIMTEIQKTLTVLSVDEFLDILRRGFRDVQQKTKEHQAVWNWWNYQPDPNYVLGLGVAREGVPTCTKSAVISKMLGVFNLFFQLARGRQMRRIAQLTKETHIRGTLPYNGNIRIQVLMQGRHIPNGVYLLSIKSQPEYIPGATLKPKVTRRSRRDN